jgi:hypothetical protein
LDAELPARASAYPQENLRAAYGNADAPSFRTGRLAVPHHGCCNSRTGKSSIRSP